jgi:hypothetical protein
VTQTQRRGPFRPIDLAEHEGLAWFIAHKLRAAFGGEAGDYLGDVWITMTRCAERYDASKGTFSTYATRAAYMETRRRLAPARMRTIRLVVDAEAEAVEPSTPTPHAPHALRVLRGRHWDWARMIAAGLDETQIGSALGVTRQRVNLIRREVRMLMGAS